ncbi:MAG TPA: hypothetical protein VNG12_17670 [Acidimicrobiales bacterium]|nr:hypothetical protein [Acidimicrobiales bacterium]
MRYTRQAKPGVAAGSAKGSIPSTSTVGEPRNRARRVFLVGDLLHDDDRPGAAEAAEGLVEADFGQRSARCSGPVTPSRRFAARSWSAP